jgi:hypothetical protein
MAFLQLRQVTKEDNYEQWVGKDLEGGSDVFVDTILEVRKTIKSRQFCRDSVPEPPEDKVTATSDSSVTTTQQLAIFIKTEISL